MAKKEMIAQIEEAHQELLGSIQGLDDDVMLEPGVSGDWSVKDILAHVSRWQAELITMLFQIQRGVKPTTVHFGSLSTDELNAKWHKESLGRSLTQVQSDLAGVHRQILRRVDEFSEPDLEDPKRHPYLDGKTLANAIADDTYLHESGHAEQIRTWRQKRPNRP